MKKGIIWLLVSFLMVSSLLLVSCAPAVSTTPTTPAVPATPKTPVTPTTPTTPTTPAATGPEMVKLTLKKTDGTTVEKLVEKPKYGGVIREGWGYAPLIFDSALGHPLQAPTMALTNEHLTIGDWTRGLTGTGEAMWLYVIYPPPNAQIGCLAESWEMADANTMVFHIRKGVHFHNKPPTNGREMTAEDVAFSLKYLFFDAPKSYLRSSYGGMLESITATDKWTVVVKGVPGKTGLVYDYVTELTRIVPPEAIKKYGDLNDWKNSVGTGPFMLTDYVTGSSVTFERFDNYWMKDPYHPDNRLPYVDGVKRLIIPDLSTQMAALRTAKIDWLINIGWEDARSLMKNNPELKHLAYPQAGPDMTINFRMDNPKLPWYDIRVRHALRLAIDDEKIRDDYYGGNAVLWAWPVGPIKQFTDMYTPMEEFPKSTRELFEYHPDKAKQLLAEAGYPNGFKASVICQKSDVDMLSIIKSYWADIGVNLVIDVKEAGAFASTGTAKSYPEMYTGSIGANTPEKLITVEPGNYWNWSMVNDPKIEASRVKLFEYRFDRPKRAQVVKEISPYIVDLAIHWHTPMPTWYNFWQPWIKGYAGESIVGYAQYYNYAQFVWVDQDLKEEMTGVR